MFLRECQVTIVKDEERTQDSPAIGVDENITVRTIVADTDLWSNPALSASALELVNQLRRILVQTEDVSIDVDARSLGPA